MKPKTRRVVGYVRISVDREQQTSTKTQTEAIKAYCAAHGWMLVDVVVERGQSAYGKKRSKRPGFKRAVEVIEAGAADTFIVWKLDRCARNTLDLLTFVQHDLAELEAEFVSVTESFDTTTPMGRAMMTIVAALAELESAQKADRALTWHEERRAGGVVPSGRAPVGYVKGERNTLEVDPVRAPIVAEAVDRVLDGESITSILRWMESEGVKLSRPGLMTLLLSPTIAGLRSDLPLNVQNGIRLVPANAVLTPGTWDPIVEPEKWHRMRAILRDPSRRTNRGVSLQYPLVPLLRCGVCGRKMIRQGQKHRTARYICRGIFDAPGTRCLNGITQGPVDEMVTAAVLAHLDDANWRKLRDNGSTAGPDPAQVEADLAKMWDMVKAGRLDMDEYADAKATWHGEIAAASRPKAELPNVKDVRAAWDGFGPHEQLLVFRRAITSLVINRSTRMGRGVDRTRIVLDLAD